MSNTPTEPDFTNEFYYWFKDDTLTELINNKNTVVYRLEPNFASTYKYAVVKKIGKSEPYAVYFKTIEKLRKGIK